jgi:hypothetical protein
MYKQAKRPRRERVKSRRGIYFRTTASGERAYEVTFTDSDGRQRWQTIPGGLKDAEAALEGIKSRKRRGERVAPSKLTLREVSGRWLETQGQADRTRDALESAFGKLLESTGGDERRNGTAPQTGQVVDLQAFRH